ncbi:MAG: IS66 family insertion sequence element accessory protein TnpB [Gammaproteobacteria bacterium]|jgi:transposase|nr:IS66 family insertion sequence element accessory protein TnpB [Gammaproteobacteria bacterium]MBQ0775201.1 IS66 family insertion sequence element accessory protein TnpB [Gammaproteobacteria bacterium]MDF1781160.1 IS66 family insertion sequence element accessory protein TnpB [Alcanivoracaceae bacterium]|tara:strand:+ start:45686 stop:46042 length:357 start_codon:yes stop_codon:yes gene_type:complete
MKMFIDVEAVYIHRNPVDFRKSINGLSVTVEQGMGLSLFDSGLFVFCNKQRDKVKILYWDSSGFCLWYKRLEKEKFKWPRKDDREIISLTEEQFHWLLRGFDIDRLQPHKKLNYCSGL